MATYNSENFLIKNGKTILLKHCEPELAEQYIYGANS